jgi:F5/8 type C domain
VTAKHEYSNEGRASVADIKDVIRRIIPRSSGLQLIRVGAHADGGYLIPDDLTEIEACFSPGVDNFKDFEDDLTNIYGIKAFMCDYTSDADKLRTPLIPRMQFFDKKWLDIIADDNNNDINDWVLRNSLPDSDLILQMDIEGAEYRNLLHASSTTISRFRILVVEFHGLENLADPRFLNGIFGPTISRIASSFSSVHAHANNCCGNTWFGEDLVIPNVVELTFLRNDRLRKAHAPIVLPHPLDANNVPGNPPLPLEGIWLENADPILSEISRLKLIVKGLRPENNVARGKQAKQSSLSKYSTAEGARGALNGIKTGGFGFHTQFEDNPWWMVDLGDIFEISDIVVFNRIDACSNRSDTLNVSVSLDATLWANVCDHRGRPTFGGVKPLNGRPPLVIALREIRCRFVKIELFGRTCLHLDEVEIYRCNSLSH